MKRRFSILCFCLQTGPFTDQETGHSDVDRDILNAVVSSQHILMELWGIRMNACSKKNVYSLGNLQLHVPHSNALSTLKGAPFFSGSEHCAV